ATASPASAPSSPPTAPSIPPPLWPSAPAAPPTTSPPPSPAPPPASASMAPPTPSSSAPAPPPTPPTPPCTNPPPGTSPSPPPPLLRVVEGGTNLAPRAASAQVLSDVDLPGYALGGLAVGEGHARMVETLPLTAPLLPDKKPRYLMGVGYAKDILEAVRQGID